MAMNWLSYQRFHTSHLIPHAFITVIGTQRQSVKEIIRTHEPRFQKILMLDSLDPPQPCDPAFYFQSYCSAFTERLQELPTNSAVIIDYSILPKERVSELEEWLLTRKERGLTFFVIFPQTYMVPFWVSDQTDYAILHRITGGDQAYRLFGQFFPDIQEFIYAIEQYAKFYESLVIDNVKQKAWWFRPYNI